MSKVSNIGTNAGEVSNTNKRVMLISWVGANGVMLLDIVRYVSNNNAAYI